MNTNIKLLTLLMWLSISPIFGQEDVEESKTDAPEESTSSSKPITLKTMFIPSITGLAGGLGGYLNGKRTGYNRTLSEQYLWPIAGNNTLDCNQGFLRHDAVKAGTLLGIALSLNP